MAAIKDEDFEVELINGRKVLLKGVGKLFYESGYPISMAISGLAEKGVEVSLLHLADELIKSGSFPFDKRGVCSAYKKIVGELDDSIQGDSKPTTTKEDLYKFCHANYEDQREMIFQYLFGTPSKGAEKNIKVQAAFFTQILKEK